MIGFELFALENKALRLCEDRAAVLSRNIANSNTPNFKARDLDFHNALKSAQSGNLLATNSHHLQASASIGESKLQYRVPMQSSLDNNTVDDEIERKNFIENAVRYQASLSFTQHQAALVLKAIRGE